MLKKRFSQLGAVILFAMFLQAGSVALADGDVACENCGTTVPAGNVINETWTVAGSPYCVTGDIVVGDLVIEPGVTVCVAPNVQIVVGTTITAIGTEGAPILFTASDPGDPWWGFSFQDTLLVSHFIHCIIECSEASGIRLVNAVPPVIQHCVFRNNTRSPHGGAITATGVPADMQLVDCTFVGNTASQHGGALRISMNKGFTLSIEKCLFKNNIANPSTANGNRVGGALWLAAGNCLISDSRFVGNRSNSRCSSNVGCNVTARGGAIYIGLASLVTIRNCELHQNRAHALNQGVCFFGGTSNSYGGAVYQNSGTLTVENCVLSCNSTTRTNCNPTDGGGGLYVNGGSATVINSTIVRNSDATGVHRAGGSLDIINSIIYFNNAESTQVGGTASITYSDVQGGYAGEGNIARFPFFEKDDCDCPDYRIVSVSPCVDAGNAALEFDDGCQPPGLDTCRNDMGAHGGPLNCNWASCNPSDINRDTAVNVLDLIDLLLCFGQPAVGGCAAADINCDGIVDVLDLIALLLQFGQVCPGPACSA